MKELARKGNISIDLIELHNLFSLRNGKFSMMVNLEELSDLKDCISQVTAKKWKKEEDDHYCPDCNNWEKIITNFCPNCGIKLEGVEE